MKRLLIASIMTFGSALATESAPLSPVLTQIQPDCQLIGTNWHDEYGIRIDDLSTLQGLSNAERQVAEALRKQLRPLGIVAAADYSCAKQDSPLDIATVKVFVFENPKLASDWWQKKYEYEGWEQHYTKPSAAGHSTVDSTQLAKRAILTSNLWITSHHIGPGTEHLILLEHVRDLLGVPEVEIAEHDGPSPDHIVRLFAKIATEPPAETRSMAAQVHMQSLPAVGREDLLAAVEGPRPGAAACESAGTSSTDPLEEIERLARETRLVIVNEAHDRPAHREFIRQIAMRLSNIGYKIYAAETFTPNIGMSDSRPFATIYDGYYSSEPVFGNLIRTVKQLGYALHAYEHRATYDDTKGQWARADEREEGQAENLLQILNHMQEDDRLLVHVGYSHASEVPIPSFEGKTLRWMAARLKEKSGLDPLTIDNTDCLSNSGHPELGQSLERHREGQFDLVVGHPDLRFVRGRPTYRVTDSNRFVEIPSALRAIENRVIIEVRHHAEPDDAVPLDRLMVWPGESLPLILPDGKYRISSYQEGTDRYLEASVLVKEGRVF